MKVTAQYLLMPFIGTEKTKHLGSNSSFSQSCTTQSIIHRLKLACELIVINQSQSVNQCIASLIFLQSPYLSVDQSQTFYKLELRGALSQTIVGPISSASLSFLHMMAQGSGHDSVANFMYDPDGIQLAVLYVGLLLGMKRIQHLKIPEVFFKAILQICAMIEFRCSHGQRQRKG